MKVVAEEGEHTRDNQGREQLTEPEEVESERRIIGRLLREFVSRHGACE